MEQIYLCGRLHTVRHTTDIQDAKGKKVEVTQWVFERWNKIISTDKFPKIQETLAEINKSISAKEKARLVKIEQAKEAVIKAQEERKALLAAANAKKKQQTKGKKGKEEEKVEEEVKVEVQKPVPVEERVLDLSIPEDFAIALQRRCPRPFTFGPVVFTNLNLSEDDYPFNAHEMREKIVDMLDATMGEPMICLQGYNVTVKGRNLKRRTTILKHGRFLKNLTVTPIYPQLVFEEEIAGDGDGENKEDDE